MYGFFVDFIITKSIREHKRFLINLNIYPLNCKDLSLSSKIVLGMKLLCG